MLSTFSRFVTYMCLTCVRHKLGEDAVSQQRRTPYSLSQTQHPIVVLSVAHGQGAILFGGGPSPSTPQPWTQGQRVARHGTLVLARWHGTAPLVWWGDAARRPTPRVPAARLQGRERRTRWWWLEGWVQAQLRRRGIPDLQMLSLCYCVNP